MQQLTSKAFIPVDSGGTHIKVIENLYRIHDPLLCLNEHFQAAVWELRIQVKDIYHLGGNETCWFRFKKWLKIGSKLWTCLMPYTHHPFILHVGRWEGIFAININSAKRSSDIGHPFMVDFFWRGYQTRYKEILNATNWVPTINLVFSCWWNDTKI